MPGLVA